jgi:hypothetical protein
MISAIVLLNYISDGHAILNYIADISETLIIVGIGVNSIDHLQKEYSN